MAEPNIQTIGEWSGRVRFHGVKPEFVDGNSPEETFAFLTIEGSGANASIPILQGEKGEKGDYAPTLNIQGSVNTAAELPPYLGNADATKAWVVQETRSLAIWTGREFLELDNILIPGPRGTSGPAGVGLQGPPGPRGPEGPSASISSSADLVNVATTGDILMKTSTGWEAGVIPMRNFGAEWYATSTSQKRLSRSSKTIIQRTTIPAQDFDYRLSLSCFVSSFAVNPSSSVQTAEYEVVAGVVGSEGVALSGEHRNVSGYGYNPENFYLNRATGTSNGYGSNSGFLFIPAGRQARVTLQGQQIYSTGSTYFDALSTTTTEITMIPHFGK